MKKHEHNALSGFPPHKRRVAEFRLWVLESVFALDRSMPDLNRVERVRCVVAQVKRRRPLARLSDKTVWTWLRRFREGGPAGLVDGRQSSTTAARLVGLRHRRQLESIALPVLLTRTAELLAIVAARSKAT